MKTIRNITCIVALAALVTGCVTYQMATPFDESALQPYAGTGTSTISGQAFAKTMGGDVKYGAGDEVSLVPVTPYTTEMTQAWRANINGVPPPTDPRLQKYVRQAIADGSGNFEFQNVPVGDYYIVCPIFWYVPNVQLGIPEKTGGVAFAQAHVGAGESVKVVATPQ